MKPSFEAKVSTFCVLFVEIQFKENDLISDFDTTYGQEEEI